MLCDYFTSRHFQTETVRQEGEQIQEIYRKSTVNQLIYFFEHNIIHNTVQLMICMYLRPIILAVNKIINSLDSLFSYDNLCDDNDAIIGKDYTGKEEQARVEEFD